jgi:glycolate oxidase FAD binding subunit
VKQTIRPESIDEAAAALRDAGGQERSVRISGSRTKIDWGHPIEADAELSTTALDRVVEYNHADLTAVIDAGVSLVAAQEMFAEHGQMLAVDPPAFGGAPTIGGAAASGDSGPLRHRYGGIRDLVLGATLVLADGTIARSGGKVIKNVAGYDLAKLFCGSFGTLGLIARIAVRLHPKPPRTVTLTVPSEQPAVLANAAATLAHLPLEMDSFDVRWVNGDRCILGRFGGVAPDGRATAGARALEEAGIGSDIVEPDDNLWAAQRAGQRSDSGATVRVSAVQTALPEVLAAATELDANVVGRAGVGIFYMALFGPPEDLVGKVEALRARFRAWPCVVLDAPETVRSKIDPWGEVDPVLDSLMRRIKQRFDPKSVCNRGLFVGRL